MFTDDELIARLYTCIYANTAVDAFRKTISLEKPEKLEKLTQAIAEGNPYADIFSDPDCSSYLLYLIENKKIPFWTGMTVYVYCIALMQLICSPLMQFPERQSLLPRHEAYQLSLSGNRVDVSKLTEGDSYYFSEVKKNYSKMPWLKYDEEKVFKVLREGSAVDAWLIRIDAALVRSLPSFHNIMQILVPDIFYFLKEDAYFTMPSFALMNAFNAMQFDEPMQFQPSLGILSKKRLVTWHAMNVHPLSLYSLLTRDNLVTVHGFDCGPLMSVVHDLAHCFWANFLSKAERDFIMKVASMLLRVDRVVGVEMDALLQAHIQAIADELRDFNFSRLSSFPKISRVDFFNYFLVSAFGRHRQKNGVDIGLYANPSTWKDTASWSEPQDDVLYVLGRLHHRYKQDVWAMLYEENKRLAMSRRNVDVIKAIDQAVQQSIPLSKARCTLFAAPAVVAPDELKALSDHRFNGRF